MSAIHSEAILEMSIPVQGCWSDTVSNLTQAELNRGYKIKRINTCDEELKDFLFTLGCYEGERVTVISILSGNYTILVKDARYSIDKELAEAICI